MRNITTKDSTGTLSLNCYEAKAPEPKPVGFSDLTSPQQGQSAQGTSAATQVLLQFGSLVCIRKEDQPSSLQPSLFYLARLDENMVEGTEKAKATYYSPDSLLAFQFVEKLTIAQVRLTSVVATVIDFNIEDDVIVLDEDIYHSLLIDFLDGEDTGTATEATEIEEEQACISCDEDTSSPSDHVGARKRSRRSARKTNSDFVFYLT